MATLILGVDGQSGTNFQNVQPPKFDNFVWDVDTVKISATGDETLSGDDDGDDINVSLVNSGIEISGTLKMKATAALPWLHGWFQGKAGGSMEDQWMHIRSLDISEVIGTDNRPSKVEVTLKWSAKMQTWAAGQTGLVDIDLD